MKGDLTCCYHSFFLLQKKSFFNAITFQGL
jgi:hypothetical protein